MFEVRVDLIKFTRFNKRGFGVTKEGIGIWSGILQVILILSIIVNFSMQFIEIYYVDQAMNEK